jgi:DNA-binding MarR family transcriptional regulator
MTATQPSAVDRVTGDVPGDLIEVVGRLRRGVRRQVRRDWPYSPLTESEVELLRLLSDRPGTRVGEAADALGLVPNTVSTLVGRLVEAGLAVRRPDPEDARAARLELTPAARRRIADRRDRRRQVVDAAMVGLTDDDRCAIEAAVPALQRLCDLVGES